MEIRNRGAHGIPGQIVRMLRPVAAFIHIGAKTARHAEIRPEKAEKRQRDPIEDLPAVRGFHRPDTEQGAHVLPIKRGAVFPAVTEPDIEAAVGVDLKIEIPVFPIRHEEKLQTAVLADRGKGSRVFRTDLFFRRPQMDMEEPGVMTELSDGADSAVRPPEDPVDFEPGDPVPVRLALYGADQIAVLFIHERSSFLPGGCVFSALRRTAQACGRAPFQRKINGYIIRLNHGKRNQKAKELTLQEGEMTTMDERISFASDYERGAHPAILKRMAETNMTKTPGYGTDGISESARKRIREACGCENAQVEFLVGGTQTNAVMIDAMLRSYQGVIAAETGHVSVHEAGAIEAGGHKVLTVPHQDGKISPETAEKYLEGYYADENHEHMVMPGMIYLSQPTEYGTLYTREELQAFRRICDRFGIGLYVDGARLAYALACPENDVTLKDLASLCDAFYIGGTKCGALFGEAVVVPDPEKLPHLFTIIKQHGALLAKGRLLGIQFDELFRDGLYMKIGEPAARGADKIRRALQAEGYRTCFGSPTNQIFCVMENNALKKLGEKVEYSFWEKYDDEHTVIRFATDWGTTEEETDALIEAVRRS